MFAWRPYARPVAIKLWEAMGPGEPFELWEKSWSITIERETGSRTVAESPLDFFIEDKRARFRLRGEMPRHTNLGQLHAMAVHAKVACGLDVEFLRLDNTDPSGNIVTITFELSRLRANASGFKEVSA